jgi:hypothetical protein
MNNIGVTCSTRRCYGGGDAKLFDFYSLEFLFMQDISVPSMTQEAAPIQEWHTPELTLLDAADAETGATTGFDGSLRS